MEQSVEIFDNDIPVFGPDLTPALGTTGDRFTIEINVTDNIDVSVVVLAYWFGSGQENVTTIWNPSGVIYVNITLPSDSLDILHYKFSVADKAGNFNDTPVRNVTIIDNDIPVFGSLIAEESSTTGDTYYLVQGIDDNIELDSVWIEYWFGEGDHENVSMTGDGPYTYLIAIPSNFTDTLHYIIHANDTSDNWNETSVRDVVILDDDNPYFAPYSIPSTLGTGQVLHVPIRAYDNVGIHAMYFEYWFGSGSHTNLTLGGSGDAILEQQIPEDSVDPFHYIVSVVDTNGNWSSFYGSIVIVDIIDPVAKCGKNITVEEDAPLTLNASGSSDNIGIVNLSWTFNVDSDVVVIYGWSPVYAFSQPGSYDILMNVTDEAGNWETDTINVIVTDITDPVIVIEPMEVNEDTSIIFDGSECTDNVGIENISYSFEDGDKDVILYGIAPGYVFSAPGIYDITLALSDEAGNKVSTVFRVTVRDVTKPTIEAGADRTVPEGTIVTLDATGSDNVGIVNWTWSISMDGKTILLYGQKVTNIFSVPGVYQIKLTAIDGEGNSIEDALSINVTKIEVKGPTESGKGSILFILIALAIAFLIALIAISLFILSKRNKPESEAISPNVDSPDIPVEMLEPSDPVDKPSPEEETIPEGTPLSEPDSTSVSMEPSIESKLS